MERERVERESAESGGTEYEDDYHGHPGVRRANTDRLLQASQV
jgi:hypothetical protein